MGGVQRSVPRTKILLYLILIDGDLHQGLPEE
jgi:hypothetical protein